MSGGLFKKKYITMHGNMNVKFIFKSFFDDNSITDLGMKFYMSLVKLR